MSRHRGGLIHEFTKAGLLRSANRTARYILQYSELYYSHETSSTYFVPRPLSLLYFYVYARIYLYFLVFVYAHVSSLPYYAESARFSPYSERALTRQHESRVDESRHNVHNMSEKSFIFPIFSSAIHRQLVAF